MPSRPKAASQIELSKLTSRIGALLMRGDHGYKIERRSVNWTAFGSLRRRCLVSHALQLAGTKRRKQIGLIDLAFPNGIRTRVVTVNERAELHPLCATISKSGYDDSTLTGYCDRPSASGIVVGFGRGRGLCRMKWAPSSGYFGAPAFQPGTIDPFRKSPSLRGSARSFRTASMREPRPNAVCVEDRARAKVPELEATLKRMAI